MEYSLFLLRFRGEHYQLSVFGLRVDGVAACAVQGLLKGGVLCMMSYWFVSLLAKRANRRPGTALYLAMCGLIVILALIVGLLARGEPITSPRPIFAEISITLLAFQTFIIMSIVWFKGPDAFYYPGLYYVGSLLYAVLTFEPLHLLGARYIAERSATGQFVSVGIAKQCWLICYSHLFEVAGSKIHYFVIPYAIGWLRLPRRHS